MKKEYIIFLAIVIVFNFYSCKNPSQSKTKTAVIEQKIDKDTLKPKLFLDFYYDMDQYEYKTVKDQVIKDHPENFDSYGNFILQTKNIALTFNFQPLIIGDKLKEIALWLMGDKKLVDLKKGPFKEVVIFTGKEEKRSVNSIDWKIPEEKILTSEISNINVDYAKEIMGNRYGVIPRFKEFDSQLSTIEPKMYWDGNGCTYFNEGNIIVDELIKLFKTKYNSQISKDSTYFSNYISGFRLEENDTPKNPTYGDIFEIRFKHRIKTIESEFTWLLPDRIITLRITKELVDKLTAETSNSGIITDIKIIYAPLLRPRLNDSDKIKKEQTDSLRIQKSKEMI